MKKIAFVIEQLYGGGAERVTAALMNEFCKESETHLISTHCHDTLADYPTDKRIVKHAFDVYKGNPIRIYAKRIAFLKKTISEINPQCVVSLSGAGTDALIISAILGKKIPLILSERNDPARNPSSKLIRILRYFNYHICDGLVFQTKGAKHYFPKGITKKSVVISNPLTDNLPLRYEGVREPRIVNCCRLVPQKNLDLLIDSFSDIAEEYSDMVLEIYGEGAERSRLEKKILDMKLENKIQLPGHSNSIFERIRKATLFVSSSDYEGISNSMLEAIALGVPVICTDCPAGGAREVIRDKENGMLVPTGDRKAMADAMRKALGNPALLEQMSKNGCNLREELSIERIAQKWKKYMEQICAN